MSLLVGVAVALALMSTSAAAEATAPSGVKSAILEAATNSQSPPYVCYSVGLAAPGSSWAVVSAPASDAKRSQCRNADPGAVILLHYSEYNGWKIVLTRASPSDFSCPVKSFPGQPTVPGPILRQLVGRFCDQGGDVTRVITGFTRHPAYKPYVFTVTGDGSGAYGGPTGKTIEPRSLNRIGRVRWTSYSQTDAYAFGVDWTLYGSGSLAQDRHWQDSGTVSMHLFDAIDGVFSKITVHYSGGVFRTPGGRTYHFRPGTSTTTATHSRYGWYW